VTPEGATETWVFGSALNYLAMIVIEDSDFSPDDHEFMVRWAEALQISVSTLIVRIVEATLDGDQSQ